jgi:hypothetical protein
MGACETYLRSVAPTERADLQAEDRNRKTCQTAGQRLCAANAIAITGHIYKNVLGVVLLKLLQNLLNGG